MCTSIPEISEDDVEVKKTVVVHLAKVSESILEDFKKFSSWRKMVRVLATMLKFVDRCRLKSNSTQSTGITVEDIRRSEMILVRLTQQRYYQREIAFYSSKSDSPRCPAKIKRSSGNLWRLDPWVDEQGILRVGGRLNKSALSTGEANPIILPKNCFITRRIAEYFHKETKHSGRTTSLHEIRCRGYWLVSANSTIRSVINQCVTCKVLRGKLSEQKMANLPPERFSTEGPFSYSAVDMFGPFNVKEGRKQMKRFVALFTCLSSRGIHL